SNKRASWRHTSNISASVFSHAFRFVHPLARKRLYRITGSSRRTRLVSLRPAAEIFQPNGWEGLFSLMIVTTLPASFEAFLHRRCRSSLLCHSLCRVFLF